MDEQLTPFVVLAPPIPVEPHFARPSPDPNELEVRPPYSHKATSLSNMDSSDVIGQRRSSMSSLIRRQD
jgi:hypothetical protein